MKLIKKEETYYLVIPGKSTNEFIASVDGLYVKHKLSIKNCEAIENGYDLDELVDEEFFKFDQEVRIVHRRQLQESLTNMFNKALELLSDKKFSESDMIHAYIEGTNDGAQFESMMDYDHSDNSEAQNFSEQAEQDFRKLLQKTEWDVEIVTKPYTEVSEGFNLESKREPKLDANGCLILRRL